MLQKGSRARAGEMIQLLKYLLLMHKALSVDSQHLHLFIYCCVCAFDLCVYGVQACVWVGDVPVHLRGQGKISITFPLLPSRQNSAGDTSLSSQSWLFVWSLGQELSSSGLHS